MRQSQQRAGAGSNGAGAIQSATRNVIEQLERRRLLSAATLLPYQSVSYTGNITSGPLRKVGLELADVYTQYQAYSAPGGHVTGSAFAAPDPTLHTTATGGIWVDTYSVAGKANALATKLEGLGASTVSVFDTAVSALVPLSELGNIAAIGDLQFARPVQYQVNTGSVDSQGDTALRAATARSTYGYDGTGVPVGALSDSFNATGTYPADLSSGDLSPVDVIQDSGGEDEGRAMLQIVHDLAPGSPLLFATAETGDAGFASNIGKLATAGAKVIADDVIYFDEPMFQDGIITQSIDSVVNNKGVSYFSAAGNEANQSYEANWTSGGTYTSGQFATNGGPTFLGGVAAKFGSNDYQSITLSSGSSIELELQWDQPSYSADNGAVGCGDNVNVYVLDSNNTVVGGSTTNTTGGDAQQFVDFENDTGDTGTYHLMVVNQSGTLPTHFKWVDFAAEASSFNPAENAGADYGHANGGSDDGVAAAYWHNTPPYGTSPATPESFSSGRGPNIYYDDSGNRYSSPVLRTQPSITAVDGVSTTLPSPFSPFYGTSAAAPHAAAVAALLKQEDPGAAPSLIYSTLASTASAMSNSLIDGAGLINAYAAVQALLPHGSIAGTIYQDSNSDGAQDNGEVPLNNVVVYVDLQHDGKDDTGDPQATTNSNGNFTISSVPDGSTQLGVVLPTGYILSPTSSGLMSFNMSGGPSVSGKTIGLFPDAFAGLSASNNYYVELDGSATNEQIWLGSTNAGSANFVAPLSELPSLSFSSTTGSVGLTLDYGNGSPEPSGKFSFTGYSGGGNSVTILGPSGTNIGTLTSTNVSVDNITQFSTLSAAQTVALKNPTGNDSISVTSVASGQVDYIDGGSGTTNVAVHATNGLGTLNIVGGSGPTAITFLSSANEVPTIYTGNGGTSTAMFTATSTNTALNITSSALTGTGTNFTFSGLGSLTVTTGSSVATVTDNQTGSSTTVSIAFNNGGDTLNVTGNGGANPTFSGSPGTVNTFGTYAITSADGTNGISINVNGTLDVMASQTLASFAVKANGLAKLDDNGAANTFIKTAALSVDSTHNGALDVENNSLIITYTSSTPLGTIDGYLTSGYAGGNWNGTGIYSSNAAADPFQQTGVGAIDNNQLSDALGSNYTSFAGTSVGNNSVLVRFTYYGDANLDGHVDSTDIGLLDLGYGNAGAGWMGGDFDYSGNTDGSDVNLLDLNYGE